MSQKDNIHRPESNLVMFPGNGKELDYIDDPLEDLLNEFSHLEDVVQESDPVELSNLSERHSNLEMTEQKADSISDVLILIEDQLDLLKDVQTRINYLHKEMESYILPSK